MSAEFIHASAPFPTRLHIVHQHEYTRHARLEIVPRTRFEPANPPQLFDLVQAAPSGFTLQVDPNRGNKVAFAGKIEMGHGKTNSVYEDSSGIVARGFIEKDGELKIVVDQYFPRHTGDLLDQVEGVDTRGMTGKKERKVSWNMSLEQARKTTFTHSDISTAVGILIPGEVQRVLIKENIPLKAA